MGQFHKAQETKEMNKKKAEEARLLKKQQEETEKLAKQAMINAREARLLARNKK
jgi:hypothetical protein